MKKINQGWQYTVYDLANGRVLKKINSTLANYFIIVRDTFPFIKHPLWKIPSKVKRCRQEAFESMRILRATKVDCWRLGNPRVLSKCSYEQDKVISVRQYWQNFLPAEKKKIINDFVELNKYLVANFFIDRNFCLADNFSINGDGKIIMSDLGEIIADPQKIQACLRERPWASPDVTNALPQDLQSYFIDKMDETFYGKYKNRSVRLGRCQLTRPTQFRLSRTTEAGSLK
jgi:hypothetical protein